ncbi:LicD family protein [Phaeobacter sp.]|uniref:LicD family protein n=1 Tax=Phaeobacter sp. TaxID=1902409 RepID=UPI0025DD801E|nr:LicD family protein [Phaeobacter sp.]
MRVLSDLDLANALFPGYGFFSRKGPFRLRAPVHQPLRKIQIHFEGGVPQSYVFPTVHLLQGPGRRVPVSSVARSAVVSSNQHGGRDVDVLQRLLNDKNIRSGPEMRPCLTIQFDRAVPVSEISLANRGNAAALRMRNIAVTGYCAGRVVSQFRGFDLAEMVQQMHQLFRSLDIDTPALKGADARERFVAEVRRAVVARLRAGDSGFEPRLLCWLLPLFEESRTPDDDEMTLMIHAMAGCIAVRKAALPTATFAPLQRFLNTTAVFEELMAGVNEVLSARLGRQTSFSAGRHIIQEQALLRRKDAYLAGLDALFPAMQAAGVTPMLAYGSLLGAVRDKGFLPHDDDVDVLYFDGSSSYDEMLARRQALVDRLAPLGFEMGQWKQDNFTLRKNGIGLDIFPSWQDGDQIHIMRRYPTYEPIPREVLLPGGEVAFYDRRYPAPANPDAFLAWRYGPGWTKSDPYYEWSWPIEAAD